MGNCLVLDSHVIVNKMEQHWSLMFPHPICLPACPGPMLDLEPGDKTRYRIVFLGYPALTPTLLWQNSFCRSSFGRNARASESESAALSRWASLCLHLREPEWAWRPRMRSRPPNGRLASTWRCRLKRGSGFGQLRALA